ncbi:hypothetical protein WS97_26200 [Burkholderia territorii]|nr:hypothetical protein WS97_26200 [Burkholderia territorii]KVQ59184.1 hypothetical protein WT22_19970 [Burkholderia territorii]KWA38712.1 hypothetical protein WT40_07500 [Burkholderia territorii]
MTKRIESGTPRYRALKSIAIADSRSSWAIDTSVNPCRYAKCTTSVLFSMGSCAYPSSVSTI